MPADELDRIVGDWIAARGLDDVMAAFQEAGAAIAPIYDMEQVVNDPHVRATDMITTVDDEDLGPLKMQNMLFRLLPSGAVERQHDLAPTPLAQALVR